MTQNSEIKLACELIHPMNGNRMNRLSVLFGLAGLRSFFLTSSGESLLLRSVVRAGLFLVLLALMAVEKQNLLRLAAANTASFRSWPRAVKGSSLLRRATP